VFLKPMNKSSNLIAPFHVLPTQTLNPQAATPGFFMAIIAARKGLDTGILSLLCSRS